MGKDSSAAVHGNYMKSRPLLAIVRGQRVDNVSAKGGRSYAQVRGLLRYVAYGHHTAQLGQEPQQRGVWLDQEGRLQAHETVQGWAKEKVHRFEYDHTYQLLLSTRDGGLSAASFNQALHEGREISQVREWRLMIHDDTDHQHAHAILFSHERLSPARYKAWQQTMQRELARQTSLQSERQLALAHEAERAHELPAERALEQTNSQDWDLAYD